MYFSCCKTWHLKSVLKSSCACLLHYRHRYIYISRGPDMYSGITGNKIFSEPLLEDILHTAFSLPNKCEQIIKKKNATSRVFRKKKGGFTCLVFSANRLIPYRSIRPRKKGFMADTTSACKSTTVSSLPSSTQSESKKERKRLRYFFRGWAVMVCFSTSSMMRA